MSNKKRVLIEMDSEVYNTLHQMRNVVLEEEKLVFFKNHTNSLQSWYRYVLSMGLVQIKRDFAKWKEGIEDEETG